ncbi:MAG: APC family permease [Bifidobacteriaceae bacterium]|nr:APC family permease [Bifidobacteriaceae bacterium]
MRERKYGLVGSILVIVSVLFVGEAAPSVAIVGNIQYFWWGVLGLAFLVPYALFTSELSVTYPDQSNIYGWITRAFGDKMRTRFSFYYWFNFVLWFTSLALLIPITINVSTETQASDGSILQNGIVTSWQGALISIAFIWITVYFMSTNVRESKFFICTSGFVKLLMAIIIVVLAIQVLCDEGMINYMGVETFLPSFDFVSIAPVTIILFNFIGLEVLTAYIPVIKNPKRNIPLAIAIGSVLSIVLYIVCAFGISLSIPFNEVSLASGIVEAAQMLTHNPESIIVMILTILFILTIFGNFIAWSYGVFGVTKTAALENSLPRVFKSEITRKISGSAFVTGIVATIFVLIATFILESPVDRIWDPNDFFWLFFDLDMTVLFLCYVPLFPAFLKLRKIDPDTPRPFKVPGNRFVLFILGWVPTIVIAFAAIVNLIPEDGSSAELEEKGFELLSGILVVVIGEVLVFLTRRRSKKLANQIKTSQIGDDLTNQTSKDEINKTKINQIDNISTNQMDGIKDNKTEINYADSNSVNQTDNSQPDKPISPFNDDKI